MKTWTKGEIPTFANEAAEFANNRGELQIEALIKRKTPNAALTIVQDIILNYASRGRWSPIRRTEISQDVGIIHIWKVALGEVFERTPGKGKHVIEFLKQILSCKENRDEIAGSRKLVIEFLLNILLRIVLPSDYRIPTNKELWQELLPLFNNNPIAIEFFKNEQRDIHQNRIIDLIEVILSHVGSSHISKESTEGVLIRHLWRTFNLQSDVSPYQQIQFAKILKPIILFFRQNYHELSGIMSIPQVYSRITKAVVESVRQAQLIVDLKNEIKTQIVKPNGFISFNRFMINDDGELQQILFSINTDCGPDKIIKKKNSCEQDLKKIILQIINWGKENGMHLRGVTIYANGVLKCGKTEQPVSMERTLL
jgi:hypothetical protein